MSLAAGLFIGTPRFGAARIATRWLPSTVAVMLACGAMLYAASVHAQEVQVPLDRAGHIQRIDATLAKRLGTFADRYPGFTEARLFQSPDSTFTFEVTMARDGQTVRERVPMTPAGADSLRAQISLLIAEKAPHAGLNQEGRTLLVAGTTALGLAFYGWALPYSADVSDGTTATGLYLVTAASSFFLPFIATSGSNVTYGTTNHALYGTTRGIVHGILVYQLVVGNDDTSQGNVAAAAAGSVVEGIANYSWAQSAHLDAGAAQTIGSLGDVGLLEGLGFATLADDYSDDRNSVAAAKLLGGAIAGLASGAVLVKHRDYSYGDAAVMRDAALLGVLGANMATDWFDPSDHNAYVAASMVGGLVGLAAGDRLVASTDFNVGQSVLIALGMVAGGSVGLGTSYLFQHESSDNSSVYLTSTMLGATLGFAATYRSFLRDARVGRATHSSWQIEMSPLGALAATAHPARAARAARPSAIGGVALVRVTCRF